MKRERGLWNLLVCFHASGQRARHVACVGCYANDFLWSLNLDEWDGVKR